MSSESSLSAAAAADAAAASSTSTRTTRRSSGGSSTWLDVIQKAYELIRDIVSLIRRCPPLSSSSGSRRISATSDKSAKDALTQLANLLPTSTFMTFQMIAPLATNNGHCGSTEKILTGALLGVFGVIIVISSFTDSVKISGTNKVYYGLVTTKGLWNPTFKGSAMPGVEDAYYTSGGRKYMLRGFDFVNAVMSLLAFGALSLFTDPVAGCFLKNLSTTVVKTVPLLVSVVISFLLAFAPAARNGIGFRVDAGDHDSNGATHMTLLQGEPRLQSPARASVGVP